MKQLLPHSGTPWSVVDDSTLEERVGWQDCDDSIRIKKLARQLLIQKSDESTLGVLQSSKEMWQ